MSADLMIHGWQAIQADTELNACDKLVLLRWAWKSHATAPAVIRFKTYARELGMSVNGVKNSVRNLIRLGYLTESAAVVSAGPKIATAEGSPSDTPRKQRDHPVTPKGSPSDPQRDHSVTPLQKQVLQRAAKPPKLPQEIADAIKEWKRPDTPRGDRQQIATFLATEGFAHLIECEPDRF